MTDRSSGSTAIGPTAIGTPPWTRESLLAEMDSFRQVYDERPIQQNEGGMRSPHMFACWYLARTLNPEVIIESGVFRGQSTWLFETACPDAKLHCLDPAPLRRVYTSDRAQYHTADFDQTDFGDVDGAKVLCFFDDHQNAYERVKSMALKGFKQAIFEDNYPPGRGDCYSLKQAFSGAGFSPEAPKIGLRAKAVAKIKHRAGADGSVPANSAHARDLARALDCYAEFPPIVKPDTTRWGDAWSEDRYPTPEAVNPDARPDDIFTEEATAYTWLCYLRLKD
ncbi:MAG: hypothetical protein ACPGOV_04220 [Magnetovibrionaceae bacterium]